MRSERPLEAAKESRRRVGAVGFRHEANVFPLMADRDLDRLATDIKEHGLRVPIVLHPDGRILDGRNRFRACVRAGVEPRFETWRARGSVVAYVLSLNLHRRHLDESQRAMVAARIANLDEGRPRGTASIEAVPQPRAAAMLNVSRASVQRAREVLERGTPELIAAVEEAQIPVSSAARVAQMNPAGQRRVVARVAKGEKPTEAIRQEHATAKHAAGAFPGKTYRVIYADPPFQYATRMPPGSSEPTDYYPTMSLADICALPVGPMTQPDAVLFLWVPSPMLPEGLDVVKAWGFTYKATFVWDKVKHNVGHYNSVRHEFLLIGVRGSCQPDARKLIDSVVSEERTTHSAKPETFRRIIDTLYPRGRRIELFRRGPAVPNWEAWGNEFVAEP